MGASSFILMKNVFGFLRCAALLLAVMAVTGKLSLAQMETATLSGTVMDQSGAVLPDAQVQVTNSDTNTTVATTTNRSGLYVVPALKPGRYRVVVMKEGFKQVSLTDVILSVQDVVSRNFNLQVGAASESISIAASATEVQMSPAVGTVVDQKLVGELPLNGRSFQTLFQLTPGTVMTPEDGTNLGQFSVNGQRTNANYFAVDGASANAGVIAGTGPGQTLGGSLPGFSAAGGTNSLVSTDAVQEFAIQTSSYAPEFGRTPGAQVSVVTKSGTNEYHGDVFNYFRNDILDSNDWFANHNGLPRAALRQNDFGGTLGGAVIKDKTFFFLSYEGLRLRQPTTRQSDVPTLAARQAAPAAIAAFFNAYPLPTGPDEGNGSGLAPANYSFSNPSQLDAGSMRVDHHFSPSLSLFGRYNHAPSEIKTRGVGTTLNTVTDTSFSTDTLTAGVTYWIRPREVNDARFNWTRSQASQFLGLDNFGGAVPLSPDSVIPAPFTEQSGFFDFLVSFAARNPTLQIGKNAANVQRQINFLDTVSWETGSHLVKFGVDFRRLTPKYNPVAYAQANLFLDVASALALNEVLGEVVANAAPIDATYNNYSLYVQDTWHPSARLSFTYGLRWEYNPTPTGHGSNHLEPFTVQGINNLSTLSLSSAGTSLYHATKDNFAPRVGFAYQLRNTTGNESIIRGGLGIFYDLGSGPTGNAFANFPYKAQNVFFGVTFPLTPAQTSAPPITTDPPFATITAFPATLKLPYTYEWNLAVEQSLGSSQTITLTYLGSAGHSLLRTDQYIGGGLPSSFTEVDFVTNAGRSNYHALEAQFRRHATKQLDVLASYTLSHSLDNGSSDSALSVPGQFVNPNSDYASSDFDIRHTGTIALDYESPNWSRTKIGRALLSGWSIDPLVTARSSPTVNVVVSRDIGFGSYNFRPDLVPGVPLYIDNSSDPGGRQINTAALSIPVANRQGDLGRNFFRGFPLVQVDLAVRRRFSLTERVGLEARVEAFNLFNHPNFSPEANQLGSVTFSGQPVLQNGFGVSQSILAQGLQSGTPGFGFSPLYQIGGPRSLQLALKLQF
jgi:hypothetical protein